MRRTDKAFLGLGLVLAAGIWIERPLPKPIAAQPAPVATGPTKTVWKKKGKMTVVTIPSIPATFTLAGISGTENKSVTFAIPSGFVCSSLTATYIYVWTNGGAGGGRNVGLFSVPTNGIVAFPNLHASGSGNPTEAGDANFIADVNAAAGGLLTATFQLQSNDVADSLAVSSLVLTLTGSLAVDHCGISPASQTTVVDIATGSYTITLYDGLSSPTVAPLGGQVFTLSDDGAGGTFLIP